MHSHLKNNNLASLFQTFRHITLLLKALHVIESNRDRTSDITLKKI